MEAVWPSIMVAEMVSSHCRLHDIGETGSARPRGGVHSASSAASEIVAQ